MWSDHKDISEMDFVSNLLPAVPSFELDPTSQYQNVTFLQNMFISAFLGTFIASLMSQTVREIIGEWAIIGHLMRSNFMWWQIKFWFYFRASRAQIPIAEWSDVRPPNWWKWGVLVGLPHSESRRSIIPRKHLFIHRRPLLPLRLLPCWSLPLSPPCWLPGSGRDMPGKLAWW